VNPARVIVEKALADENGGKKISFFSGFRVTFFEQNFFRQKFWDHKAKKLFLLSFNKCRDCA